MHLPRTLAFLSLAAGLVTALPAQATPQYTVFDLGTLVTAGLQVYATGINNSGQVVGYTYTDGFDGHAFNADERAFVTGPNGSGITDVGTLGGAWSRAHAINDRGQVVGTSALATGGYHAFIGGTGEPTLRDLGTLPGSTWSTARAINGSGQVAGTTSVDSPDGSGTPTQQRAFYTQPDAGALHPVDNPLGGEMITRGIDDQGRVVGYYADESVAVPAFHTGPGGQGVVLTTPQLSIATISADGRIGGALLATDPNDLSAQAWMGSPDEQRTLIDFSGVPSFALGAGQYSFSAVQALNRLGQAAGGFGIADAETNSITFASAYVTGPDGQGALDVGTLLTLAEGDRLTRVTGINDKGQFIVNTWLGHAYLVSPVPEPATAALWAAGGLLLIGRKKWPVVTPLP